MTDRFIEKERLRGIIERLTSMAEYAEAPSNDWWERLDALRQMLRGEIARLEELP